MKRTIIFIQLLFAWDSYGQNLVLNPSFEDTISCYDWMNGTFGNSLPCSNWYYCIQGSPDYYSPIYCGNNYMPSNTGGYQWARTGIAYEGFGTYAPNVLNHHEFIGGQLSDTLKQGHSYCIKFYLSAADNWKYFTDGIGIYFSSDTIQIPVQGNYAPYYIPYTPQIEIQTGIPITDTMNWTLVSGTLIASGGELFFAIGNFRDDNFITLDSLANSSIPEAYYFIDDVSVVDCTATSIHELQQMSITIQNPINDKIRITTNELVKEAELFNSIGEIVIRKTFEQTSNDYELNVATLPNGIYLLKVLGNNKNVGSRKIFKL